MAAAPAIISGVSAVGGLVASSSQASKQKAAINEQMRAAETQRILNRMELKSQEQSVELNNQRQQQLLGSQQAVALMQNDLENQQSNLQNTQAQIEQDRQQVLNTQRVFQRKAVANQQAAQIFRQTSQQQLQQQNELTKAGGQEAQRENALAGSNVQQQGSVSSEMAAERLALAVQNGQIDLDSLYNTQVQDELRQLGYEYDVADIEQRIGQLGLDYQQRDLGRVGELTGVQYNSNKEGIETQSQRNRAAMDYELATSKTALAQASVSNEATSNAQMSALQSQKSMTKGPSMFDWMTTLGGIGLDVYRSNPNNQAKRPTNNRGFTLSDTKTAFPDNLPGGPSYIPASSMDGAPSYIPKQLDYPTEMVFNRPRSSYGYANKAARSVFGRN